VLTRWQRSWTRRHGLIYILYSNGNIKAVVGFELRYGKNKEAQISTSRAIIIVIDREGGMSEAQTGCTVWKDVSKGTFERLVQVAYTGDYSIPSPTRLNGVENPDPSGTQEKLMEDKSKEEIPVDYDSFNEMQQRIAKKDKKKGKMVIRYVGSLSSSPPPLLAPRDIYYITCEPAVS